MAKGEGSPEPEPEPSDAKPATNGDPKQGSNLSKSEGGDDGEEDEEEEEEEEEEPRLKYTTVTTILSSLYRNGDAVSALLVAGDKMVCMVVQRHFVYWNNPDKLSQIVGTHNGNIVNKSLRNAVNISLTK